MDNQEGYNQTELPIELEGKLLDYEPDSDPLNTIGNPINPEPPQPENRFLFSCDRCNSLRLELLWLDKESQQIQVRCLSCGSFAFIDPTFKFKLIKEKGGRKPKKELPNYV